MSINNYQDNLPTSVQLSPSFCPADGYKHIDINSIIADPRGYWTGPALLIFANLAAGRALRSGEIVTASTLTPFAIRSPSSCSLDYLDGLPQQANLPQ